MRAFEEKRPAVSGLNELALPHASRTFAALAPDDTVEQALASIRSQALDSAIVYFYVVDDDRRLRGVVPTRRLLMAAPDATVASLMTDAPVTLPPTATVREAAALLMKHRLLAVPVVGALGRMLGVVDAAALDVDIAAELNGRHVEEIFQTIGVRIAGDGPSGFRARFPPLLWNVFGGLLAAAIAGAHEHLLTAFTPLALFMPVTLALSESIGVQSVVLALERRSSKPRVAAGLGFACAGFVALAAIGWLRDWRMAAVIAVAIPLAMMTSAAVGLVVPGLLTKMRRNPSVAAGPIVLAAADFVCLIVYFRVAAALL